MSVYPSNCIYRKLFLLLTFLLVSVQMVLAQQDSTVDTEPKVYGNVYDGTPYYADSYESGDGSKDKPYLISNDMQLAKLAHDVNNGVSFSGKYFKLTKDIDLSHALWTPIGSWNPKTPNFFAGKFDGDGHKISNMHICWTNADGQEASWGLFSRLAGSAANEAGFACVTNLVIEKACVEKTKGYRPVGNGTIKLGVVAADLTKNAEISNIIIRNSKVTDNEEAYDANGVYRIGGIVGYINGGYHRIFNISADVSMNMHKNATCKKAVTISGGIGCATSFSTNSYTILPTNIYVHGPGIITNGSNSKGSVIAFYGSSYQKNFPASNKATLYYSHANAVSGSTNYNDGTEHEPTDIDPTTGKTFFKTFTEIANAYINDNKLDRKTWAYSATSNSFAFSSIALKMERGKEDVLTVVDEEGNAMKDVYDWYVSHGNAEPVKVNTDKLNPFTLQRQTYAQTVYATDGNSTTNTLIVNPITLSASLTTSKSDFTVNVTNDSEEHLSNDELGLDITYEWYNGTERLTSIPTSQNIVTRPTDSSKGRKYYCKVTVKSGSSVLLEKYVNVSVVVYLCPAGVTTSDGNTYAKGADNLTDDSWGYTPDKPMLTWKGAYSKLSAKGSWDENTIVLMGTSSPDVTFAGFCLTPNYQGENLLKYDDWAKAKRDNPQLFRNTTITGKWDKDYKGSIEIKGASRGLPIWGDTRFENLTFAMNGGDNYKIIYCQYNNILMDEGIRMTGFSHNSPDYGTIDGAVTNALHIFGGINNDGRFYPLNNTDSIAAYNASMPHGKEGFSISVKSGFYSCISAGGRQSVTIVDNKPAKQNGIMGTPQQPIKCTIDIDIDRTWNDLHNEQRMVTMNDSTKRLSTNDYDAGVILAGNHEGAMYADVNIIIRSGKVARVVNGTLGAQTELTLPYDDKTYNVPCNTFMGRANITLDPSSSENNKDEYTDKRVIVTELYGGSTGRGHTGNVVVNNPFYGISTVTINGGTFQILPENNDKKDNILCGIFGAGAGGMNGIGYGDDAADTHTPDDRIPYWNDRRDVMLYGPYATAKDRLVSYHCYNTDTQDFTEVSPTDTRSEIVINGGEFGYASAPIDGIYGGGSGFMSKSLWTKKAATPSQYGGNVYGNGNETDVVTSLTINGGEFYCQKGVFAGGRGTDYFFSTDAYGNNINYGNYKYKELGKTYGNVKLTINGGIFHCPVFGGGYGVADAKQLDKSNVETLSRMARIYGKSDVNIQGGVFFNNVYGGGDMAVVENRGGDATNVVIGNNADIRGSVFAGGNGRRLRPSTQTFAANDNMTQHPDSVGLVIGNANVSLIGSAEQAPYVYGDIFGGGNLAQVSADTYVSIYAGNMAGQIFGGGNGDITNDNVTSADVLGNTNVMLAQDEGSMSGEGGHNENNEFSINVIWNRKWDSVKNLFYVWDSDIKDSSDEPAIEGAVYKKDEFFANGKFLNPHNIYGGGNLACNVAGKATVLVQKGTTPYDLLTTDEWKQAYTDNDNPHFSVFGGGYGQLTKVGSTDVTVNVDGDYGKYDTEVDDNYQMAPPKISESGTFATHTERSTTTILPVFDNSMGIPNFTVWGVLGGGYAGTVADSTKVTVDGKTFVHRVFGGGFGDPASTKDNTTGQIGGKTEVYLCGARIHGDVFGGGAGLKPTTPSSDHFVNVARVVGTTKVEISDDAKIYGNVYGGGDNANVGEYVSAKPSTYYSTDSLRSVSTLNQTDGTFISYEAVGYRSFVNISGGTVFGEVYGGGKGLTKAEADHYYNVGRINGNTLVHITDSKPGNDTDKDNIVPYVWSNVYGGCAYGTVDGNTLVHVEGGMLGNSVFGGGFMGDVLKGTTVRIGTNKPDATSTLNNSDIYIHGNIYGGNDVSGYVNVVLNKDGYFKDNGGTGANIQIFGGHIYGDVYGAGNGNYLYANDRNGNKKVTVNEYYPLNPDDPKSETVPLVYTVPMRSTMPSLRAATDAVKIVNINSWRPLTNRVSIDINGSATDTIHIDGNVYGGGNSATVQKVLAPDEEDSTEVSDEMVGDVSVNIGSHVRIGGVFMGCNGDDMFVTSEDNDYMNMFQKLNGDVDDHSKELNLADSIDWTNDPANMNISTVYLPTENSKRPLVYPHLIDLYFQPVETDIQGSLTWNGSVDGKGLEDCIIGTFCCGGNRGNMNVMPLTAADNDRKIGNVVDYVFPEGLTITEKIVGGCNNANYDYKGKAFHEGGYLLGIAHSIYPFINLTIRNRFLPKEKDGAYVGGSVYGGCFKSGTIRGDVTINMQTDMLAGKEKKKLEKSNELLIKDSEYSSLNVYGAGYGMESYVYGNTEISFGDDVKCSDPQMDGGKFLPCGVSANFVYGGGQQGNVIGVTNVDILNGHVFRAVTGGSYSGYVFGSTQVKVGYPTYYHVNSDHYVSGRYVLNRTDQKNLHLENNNGTETSPTIKQNIYLLTDELVSQGTYDDIVAIDNGNGKRKEITEANKDYYFTKVTPEEPSVGWDNVHINIDEAVYGGGYSIAQGSSVLANNTTVLKFTDVYNADKSFTSEDELEELKHLPNGTTAGFGGNTLILIGDNKNHEHITISRQEMKAVKVSEGTDLYGYYYKHYDNDEAVANDVYTYRYISLQDKYFYKGGSTPPAGLNGIRENVFYEYDSEGGIFGDGHLSYAQGFRSADVTGYGFAEHTIDNPKILNTFQRLDIIRLEDNCFSLLGARDYTVNEINKTPYSISRVGEIKMVADNIRLDSNGNLEAKAKADNDETFKYSPKARNYMGFSNNIHYVGAVTSNVSFDKEMWHNRKGELASATNEEEMSYQDVKQKYIDDYQQNKDNVDADDPLGEFQKRNDGTAKNMIGIASGYAMKIQLCQDTYDKDYKKVVEKEHYGPIYGVVEMNLINVRQDEGGGYVYADNNHKRHEGDSHKKDFLETTGNFVFPYHEGRYIVDDCFPTGYYSAKNVEDVKVHYWYVTGFHYYYNVNITGYTYQSSKDNPLEFDSDNKDGLTVLSGLKSGQKVRIQTWKMRSGHPEDKDAYSSDLEYRNYLTGKETDETDRKYYSDKVTDGYRLYVGGAATNSFSGARTEEDTDKAAKGFAAQLSMREKGSNETTLLNNTLPAGLKEDAKIAFKLVDMVDNTNYVESGYYDKHLSKKSLATLVIKAPAYEEYVSDTDNKPIYASTGKLYKKTEDGYVEVTSGKLDADSTYYQPQTEEFVKIDSLFMYDTDNKKYEKVSDISDITIDENRPVVYYVPREYTYTIYLTIEYVQGPTVSGHINVGNCVLPGEMIRVTKDDLVVNADQSFAVSGYYWRIGKREKTAEGKWTFSDTTPWTKENIKDAVAKGYDTFNQADEKGSGLFTGCHYDKTDDYLDIPAYYYMNGYGIQLGVAITGVNDIMQIDMQEADRLTVHNFHRMDAHKAGINLHLAEAIKRAKEEGKTFAEPRIYIADQSDLKAFAAFVDSIGNGSPAPRYGANAQFVLQNDLTMSATPKDGAYISSFAGILHGNGHIINGVGSDNALFGTVTGNIYNLGLSSGRLSGTTDENVKPNYHCCFEYAPSGSGSTPVVYRWDGSAYKGYTRDDFRLGRVAYDLNEYYLLARNKADKDVLKYVADYYANGDYQYACRTDAITGKNTGITYLRIGKLSDIPNYEQVETRHDKTHPTDAPRLVTEDGASHYVPLFNDNKNGAELMNDYLFWGQSLQSEPENLPNEIASHQLSFMSNRVYRTAAYYGSTALDAFHYNAYSQGSSSMNTYVHDSKTTAIDFTCKDDLPTAMGMTEQGIFYPPVNDNATAFSDFRIKDGAGITQNLLVYTADDNTGAGNEAYDVVKNTLGYEETTREALIKGHHVVKTANDSYATSLLHLVERTSDNVNSEGEECLNNDLCVPIAFNVTDRAWYVRKPMAYAEDYYGAWEGICLPFTADKAVASLNGEITHFYGSPSAEETANPKQNIHTLHHEYWLRSLTSVGNENGKPSAVFQRPDNDTKNGVKYTFNNTFFIDNYSSWLYNKDANPYYAEKHEYAEYPRLAAEKPYIVRFPGERYYEFDLSSAFYNKLLGKMEEAQTIAFNAYGKTQGDHTSYGTITVPITKTMQTVKDGYAHSGTFAAVEVSEGKVYGINKGGTAFDDASALSTVMPFRTYMSVTTAGTMASPAYSSLINISELKGGTISPDAMDDEDNAQNDGIIVRPIGGQRVRVESTVRTRMNVVTAVGQLYRILDVQPGIATYSGFQPGLYIFGKTKVIVK